MKLICNDKEFEINEGESIKEALREEIEKDKYKIITCNFNNEIKSLNYIPKTSGKVELLDYSTTEGKRVYVRGIMYIMAMGTRELFPDSKMTINYQLDNSMFCTFENMQVTDEILDKIRKKMEQIIEKDMPIKKIYMTQEEAKEFYEKEQSIRRKIANKHRNKRKNIFILLW